MAKVPAKSSNETSKAEVLERYNNVVARAELQTIQLTDFSFHVDPGHFVKAGNRKLSYQIKNEVNEFFREDGLAFAHVDMTVNAKVDRKKTLACTAKYVAVYDNLGDCDEKEVKVFLSRVAPIACYPYFRGIFASLNWAAGADLPPLPVHREPTIPRPKTTNS